MMLSPGSQLLSRVFGEGSARMLTCLCVVLGFGVLIAIGTIGIRVRTRQIAASRPGENYEVFRSSFEVGEAPPDVLWAVYATFQEWCSETVAEFPVRAADHIGDIYGMVDEDLDDAVLEVLEECGRRLPPDEQLRQIRPIVTIRDFVLFVVECPAR
jgi:hypothetical protein